MHIGNHAVLYGPRIVEEASIIAKELKNGGSEGLEIGKRFLGAFESSSLNAILTDTGMKLSAYHMVAMLPAVLDAPEAFHKDIVAAAEYLEGYPVKNILLSAMAMPMPMVDEVYDREKWDQRLLDPAQVRKLAETFNAEAEYLKARGIQLHLHNHDWEFLWDGLLLTSYLNYAPAMNIGLDIGWCWVGGKNPVELFEEYPERFTYIHARDLHLKDLDACTKWTEKHGKLFCDLGEGEMPLEAIFRKFKEITGDEGWITIEYETGDQAFSRYQKATAYLSSLLDK